jgi:uncharacterized membrane protein
MNHLFFTLLTGAVTVGAIHSLAPDHWAPFAALARSRGWSAARTARATILCGFGHVTVSALLGLLALGFGIEMIQLFGKKMEAAAGVLLIVFGLVYAVWGLRRAAGRKLHGHSHSHYDHIHEAKRTTEWTLFALFSADPCIAVIPIMFAAAPLGAVRVTSIVVAYEIATLATMVLLVLPARAGANLFRAKWLDVYGDACAGGFIATVGVVVGVLGI